MTQFRTGLMLGVTLLAAGMGAAASAQGYRIDQMPGAYNRDEAPDRVQNNNGYPPGVVAVPPKGTIVDPPQGSAASQRAAATPRARPAPAATGNGMPSADEIASVYARTFAAGTTFKWAGAGTVVGVEPFMNIELGRWEFRVSPSSVTCTKTKAPGYRCKYTVIKEAVAGEGFMSRMSAAVAQGMTKPEVVTRSDQFVRNAGDIKSATLEAGFAAGRAAYASSNQGRYAQERQEAEEERERQARATDESMRQTYEMIYAK